jgi:hypothetical protein
METFAKFAFGTDLGCLAEQAGAGADFVHALDAAEKVRGCSCLTDGARLASNAWRVSAFA